MAALKNEHKLFLVQSLACFGSLDEIKAEFKKQFGIDITSQQIQSYDPTKIASAKLSQKWRDAFKAARERFQNEVSDIPIANKAYRLRKMNEIIDKAERMKNFPLALQTLEQAAKECGDAYTNKSKVDHTSSDRSMSPSFDNGQYQQAQSKLSDLD